MRFITFEGIDGCGKSTLMTALANELQGRGFSVDQTREPGGTPLAEELRNIILRKASEVPFARTELLLYEAARAQHVDGRIRPALQEGKWVLCDRFYDSSLAFQGAGRLLKMTDVSWLNDFATGGLKPDLTILLDCPVEVGQARRKKRQVANTTQADRIEAEKKAFHEAVRRGFLSIAELESERFLVLDAMKKPEELFQDLMQALHGKGWL